MAFKRRYFRKVAAQWVQVLSRFLTFVCVKTLLHLITIQMLILIIRIIIIIIIITVKIRITTAHQEIAQNLGESIAM